MFRVNHSWALHNHPVRGFGIAPQLYSNSPPKIIKHWAILSYCGNGYLFVYESVFNNEGIVFESWILYNAIWLFVHFSGVYFGYCNVWGSFRHAFSVRDAPNQHWSAQQTPHKLISLFIYVQSVFLKTNFQVKDQKLSIFNFSHTYQLKES